MIVGTRLSRGSAGSAKGAASFVAEAITTARQAGATGVLLARAALGAVLDVFNTILATIYTRVLIPPPLDKLLVVTNRRYDRARVRLRRIIGGVITDRRASGVDRGDLLSTLLTARDPADRQGLSDTEILDQVITFFLAGSETTATTLAWAVHLLAGHPEVERRLHAEVDAVLAGAVARFDDLPKLELTSGVVIETLRLLPGRHVHPARAVLLHPRGLQMRATLRSLSQ
ncbi:MAG: cytochrome P450 [Pseudonocardiaceae bacterium]